MSWKNFCATNLVPKSYINCNIQKYSESNDPKQLRLFDLGFDFCHKPFSLIIKGPPGVGKTYFMYSLINSLLENKKIHMSDLRLFNAMELDHLISQEIKNHGSAKYLIETLREPEFIFIDDFGIEMTRDRAEKIYFSFLDKRLEDEKVIVFSTNLSDEDLLSIFGARINSRLNYCKTLLIDGPDLRKPRK